MTLEELLNCSAAKLESLSDKELNDFLSPFFPLTRPEYISKEKVARETKSEQMPLELRMKIERANKIMQEKCGVDISQFLK